ncbi:MAG: PTS sugar transporter subunit IIA [bacterium]
MNFNIFNNNENNNRKDNKVNIYSPLAGEIVSLEEVPDKAFSQKMVGEGLAIKADSNILYSPVSGKVVKLFSTNHALGITTSENIDVLIHIGIDSVKLEGKGFEAFVGEGQEVSKGDKLISIDWDILEGNIPSLLTPVVITNFDEIGEIKNRATNKINTGDILYTVELK